jgi:UDP-N-acetylmuramoyl-tripeptide--D-alanyl-D-alanine ligase
VSRAGRGDTATAVPRETRAEAAAIASSPSSQPPPAQRPLDFALQAMGGALLASPGAHSLAGLSFAGAAADSRMVTPGRLFFALPGERVDGFDYCAAAVAAGAAAVVVPTARGVPAGCANVPVIGVADARTALGDLARAARARFTGKVIGVTGSNGKTTTKELCAAALAGAREGTRAVLKTAGNFNTDVGLPLTILEATGEESFWVLEMAMRARGEIAFLANIAVPHVGLVTNVAAAHLGRLGSLAEVARAKGEIFAGLADGGIGVLPNGEPLLEAEAQHLPAARKLRFGAVGPKPHGAAAEGCDVRILDFAPSGAGGSVVRFAVGQEPVVVRLPLPGEHNARNAAAALAVVMALGLPVAPAAARLGRVALPGHRSSVVPIAGRMVLDDCYNANPASMTAALRTLATSARASGRAFAVVGDMLELGPEAAELHAEIGRLAAGLGLAGLVALGPLGAKVIAAAHAAGLSAERLLATNDPAAAAVAMAAWTGVGDWVLVKASRGMRLERVIEALEARLTGRAPVVEERQPPRARAAGKLKTRAGNVEPAAPVRQAKRTAVRGAKRTAVLGTKRAPVRGTKPVAGQPARKKKAAKTAATPVRRSPITATAVARPALKKPRAKTAGAKKMTKKRQKTRHPLRRGRK